MTKYSFSSSERYAVFVTHGEKCYMCTKPIDLETMEVDHLIPETLLEKPDVLQKTLSELEKPLDFNLNSFANWMPSCRTCNRLKSANVFEPTLKFQLVLQKAARKAGDAQKRADEIVSNRKISNALNALARAIESGVLERENLIEKISPLIIFHTLHRAPEMVEEPIRFSPLFEILSEENNIRVVRGPYGVGARPIGTQVHSSWNCPHCGSIGAWSGPRCVICGNMDDD